MAKSKKKSNHFTKEQVFHALTFKIENRSIMQDADCLYKASKILLANGEKTLATSVAFKAKNIRRKLLEDNNIHRIIDFMIDHIKPDEEFFLNSYEDLWPNKIKSRMPSCPIYIRKWIFSTNPIKKIYTDGSFHIDGGMGVVAVDYKNIPVAMVSGCMTDCAGSYEAEYAGVVLGLKIFESESIRKVLHDVSLNVAQDAAISVGFKGDCQHVNGHSGHWYNEITDRLASKRGGLKNKELKNPERIRQKQFNKDELKTP